MNISSTTTIFSVLTESLSRRFYVIKVQLLYEKDNLQRIIFCNTILNIIQNDSNILTFILWNDECIFTRNGHLNSHNSLIVAYESLEAIQEFGYPRKCSVNVWLGILNLQAIGPLFLRRVSSASTIVGLYIFWCLAVKH